MKPTSTLFKRSRQRLLFGMLLPILCVLAGSANVDAQTYCTPIFDYPGNSCWDGLSHVSLSGYSGSTLNDNPPCSYSTDYFDRTSTVASIDFQQGHTYTGSITLHEMYYSDYTIWIDFNDDGTFSSSEKVADGGYNGSYLSSYSVSFTIPLSAATGTHRMRIKGAYTGWSSTPIPMDPCDYLVISGGNYYYCYEGSVADYTVNIVAAPACTGTPSVTTTPSGSKVICPGGSMSFTGDAGIYSGLSYQWQEYSGGSWNNISGATSTSYTTPSISTCSYYRMQVTCAGSSSTGSSAADTVCPGDPTYASLPYVQDFEDWSDYCKRKDVPGDGHWKNSPASGSNSWRREDEGATAGWAYPSDWGDVYMYSYLYSPAPVPSTHFSGNHAARFHSVTDYRSYGYTTLSYLHTFSGGYVGNLDLYVNCSAATGNKLLQFYYQNPDYPYSPYRYYCNDSLIVYMSTDGGSTFNRIWARDSARYFTKVQIQLPSNSATTIIRFQALRDDYDYYGGGSNYDYSDILIDSVYVGPPCDASFTAGNVTPAGPLSGCAGATYSFNGSGVSLVGGLTYQWKYATPPFTTFSNMPGDTTFSMTSPPLFDSVQYELAVTCPYSSTTKTTAPAAVNLNNKPAYAAINLPPPVGPGYHYSFENWASRCGNNDAPVVGAGSTVSNWGNYPYTGNSSWRREDKGSTAGWYYYGTMTSSSYAPHPLSKDSSHCARFYSYDRYGTANNDPGNLYLFLDCSTIPGTKELQFYAFAGASKYGYTPPQMNVKISTDGGASFSPLTSITNTDKWNFYRFPVPSNSAKTIIQFQGQYKNGSYHYDYSSGLGLDGVKVLPPCQGMPTAGFVSNASPCSGKKFDLQVYGTSAAAGLHYQWQQSPDGTAWASVAGDTTPSATFNITAPTYYRVFVTCTNSGQTDTTAAKLINLAPFYYCYCDPTASVSYYNVERGIGNFSMISQPAGDTIYNNGNPLPRYSNPRISDMYRNGGMYNNYDTISPTPLIYLDSLYRIGIIPSYYSSYYVSSYSTYPELVWIDYNHNAIFDNDELIFRKSPGTSLSTSIVSDTFRVRDNAMIGITGMRVMDYLYNYYSPFDPCWSYPDAYGEVQDYLINVNYRPCDGPVDAGTAGSTDTSICEGYNFKLYDTTHEYHQSGITWYWQQSPDKGHTWAAMAGTTDRDTISQTYTFAHMGDTSWYRVAMICENTHDTTYSNIVQIHKGPHYACYCFSMAVGGTKYDSSDVGAFTIGGFVVNKRGPHILNPAATGSHTNYTGTIIDLDVDSTYPVGVYHILRSAKHADGKVTLFMDFNHNYQYDAPEERVWTGYTTASDWYITTSVTIPHSVVSDVPTGMRLIINNNTAPNVPSDEACGVYTSGETMDFVVRFNHQWPTSVGTISGIQDLLMYPNPTDGKFQLQFNTTGTVKDLHVSITDMTGREVFAKSYTNMNGHFSTNLDLSKEARGVYFVTFTADGERMIRKLVLE